MRQSLLQLFIFIIKSDFDFPPQQSHVNEFIRNVDKKMEARMKRTAESIYKQAKKIHNELKARQFSFLPILNSETNEVIIKLEFDIFLGDKICITKIVMVDTTHSLIVKFDALWSWNFEKLAFFSITTPMAFMQPAISNVPNVEFVFIGIIQLFGTCRGMQWCHKLVPLIAVNVRIEISGASREAVWLDKLIKEFKVPSVFLISSHCDNKML